MYLLILPPPTPTALSRREPELKGMKQAMNEVGQLLM